MINTILTWILVSSADANKLSLTIKGMLGYLVPVLMYTFNLDQGSADIALSDAATLLSTLVFAVGLARKIYLTLTHRNEALY